MLAATTIRLRLEAPRWRPGGPGRARGALGSRGRRAAATGPARAGGRSGSEGSWDGVARVRVEIFEGPSTPARSRRPSARSATTAGAWWRRQGRGGARPPLARERGRHRTPPSRPPGAGRVTVGAHIYMAAVSVELPRSDRSPGCGTHPGRAAEFVARFRQGRLVTVRSSHDIDRERPGLVVAEVNRLPAGLLIDRPGGATGPARCGRRRRRGRRPGAAEQAVGAGAARQAVAPGAAAEDVGAGLAEQAVRASAALERVGPRAAADEVVAAEGVDHVVAAEADDHVGLGRALEPVAAVAADHRRRPAGAARRGRPGAPPPAPPAPGPDRAARRPGGAARPRRCWRWWSPRRGCGRRAGGRAPSPGLRLPGRPSRARRR